MSNSLTVWLTDWPTGNWNVNLITGHTMKCHPPSLSTLSKLFFGCPGYLQMQLLLLLLLPLQISHSSSHFISLCRCHKTVKISSKAAACRGSRKTSSRSLKALVLLVPPTNVCPGRCRCRCHWRCYHYRIRHPATALQARTKVATFFIATHSLIEF